MILHNYFAIISLNEIVCYILLIMYDIQGCGVLAGVLGNVVVLTLSGQGRLDVYQTRNTTSTIISHSMEPLVTDEPL